MTKIKPIFILFLAAIMAFSFSFGFKAAAVKSDNPQKEKVNAEIHRSVVANFVQNLLKVASRSEGGIGEQVRVVAREQNMAKERVAESIEQVQSRNKIRTFLIGSDYKNLGELRSEMVQTRNRLEQLTRLMENVASVGEKTELEEQVQTLEQERTRIENFIKAQEGKFSLFGWLVKLFSR